MYNNGIDHNHRDMHLHYMKDRPCSLMMKFPSRIHINEWTFSFSLFIMSSTIVIVKLLVIYADLKTHLNCIDLKMTKSDNINQYANESLSYSRSIDEYKKGVVQTMMKISNEYGWLLKAISSGLGILGVTWFIIYKDSNIPGINPPSPFSPSKKKLTHSSTIQMNYLVGIINGILIFIYMSLQ